MVISWYCSKLPKGSVKRKDKSKREGAEREREREREKTLMLEKMAHSTGMWKLEIGCLSEKYKYCYFEFLVARLI